MVEDEREKFQNEDVPMFLDDEWFDHSVVSISLSIQTVEKLLKMRKQHETIGDCIERILTSYEES